MDEHRRYGVDVKVQKAPEIEGAREALGDEAYGAIWDGLCEDFWRSVNDPLRLRGEGQAFGFNVERIYQEGRSGGWAVPEPKIDPEDQAEQFAAFRKWIAGEVEYWVGDLWPERVREAMAEKAAREANPPPRFAMAVVVAAPDAETAWEEVERLLAGQHPEAETGAVFLGDPLPVPTAEEYATGEIRLRCDGDWVPATFGSVVDARSGMEPR